MCIDQTIKHLRIEWPHFKFLRQHWRSMLPQSSEGLTYHNRKQHKSLQAITLKEINVSTNCLKHTTRGTPVWNKSTLHGEGNSIWDRHFSSIDQQRPSVSEVSGFLPLVRVLPFGPVHTIIVDFNEPIRLKFRQSPPVRSSTYFSLFAASVQSMMGQCAH